MDEESAKQEVQQNASRAIDLYFETQDFSIDEYSSRDKGRIEQVINHIVDILDLPRSFKLGVDETVTSKASISQRLWLRGYVTRTLAQRKHSGKIRRIMHGVYRP